DEGGVDVVGPGVDVHEHRRGPAVRDGVGGGDERVADGDELVPGPDAQGVEGQVQRRRATRHRGGVRRPDVPGERLLEGGHPRPGRGQAAAGSARRRASRHAASSLSPSATVVRAANPSSSRARRVSASRRGTGLTLRGGRNSGSRWWAPVTRWIACQSWSSDVSVPLATLYTSSDRSDFIARTLAAATSPT